MARTSSHTCGGGPCPEEPAPMTVSQQAQDSFEDSLTLNSPPRLTPSKRQGSSSQIPSASKRTCSATTARIEPIDEPPRFCFRTAGTNREITVSEAALCSARARLAAASEGGEQNESDIPSSSNEDSKPPPFAGFVTAGSNTVISVSNAALDAARRRLQAETGGETSPGGLKADVENRDPCGPVTRSKSNSERASSLVRKGSTAQQSGFVPPLLKRTSGSTLSTPDRSTKGQITRTSSRRFNSPLLHSPAAAVPTVSKGSVESVCNVAMPSNAQASFSGHERDVLTRGTVQAQIPKVCTRLTCVRELKTCPAGAVDFLGIVVESTTLNRNNVPVIKVADRYGERVLVEVLTASIPQSISRGSVISIEGATLLRNPDLTLILNDSAFVDMEPNDPETGCLHRLFDTGLFDSVPSEDDFTFDSTALRLIGRLNEFPDNASTVMARICSINYDALVYLGCSSCKRYARRSGDGLAPCQECANRKAKYFYSLHVEISDFSGMVAVHFSDEAAERLIGKPAGAMVKVPKSVLQSRLSSFYYRPMLFRVSLQSSRWFVDDWKELDIPRFKPFLKDIAAQKGFK